MTRVTFDLSEEHIAMLDSMRGRRPRGIAAKQLVIAVLDDDAAAHQAVTSSPDKVIYLRNWQGAR